MQAGLRHVALWLAGALFALAAVGFTVLLWREVGSWAGVLAGLLTVLGGLSLLAGLNHRLRKNIPPYIAPFLWVRR